MIRKKLFLLLLLTLIGGFLRFFLLKDFPVSLNWDEASHGYNAYSILKTGKDEWGRTFPLIFRAFGDYKLPLYIYLTAIPVWLFGLSEFSIRFISALAGTLAIPGVYFLIRELFPNRKFELGSTYISLEFIGALILTLLPWHIFISRPALEANLSLTLIIFGFYFLLRFYNHKSSLLPSVILLGLSLHTYNTARVFVPLLILLSIYVYRPSIKINFNLLISSILIFLFGGLVLYQIYLGEGTARYEKLKILSPSAVFQIGQQRAESSLPPVLARLVHNRPIYFSATVIKNYLSYFSPDFFSQRWGSQYQFAIPNKHLLTIPVFIFALVGFLSYVGMMRTDKNFRFLYLWLFLSPVAAALTADPPQALRPNPMIPAIVIFTCFGISRVQTLFTGFKKLGFLLVLGSWFVISVILYISDYFVDYSQKYSLSWQYGNKQIVNFINEHSSEYEKIFITKRWGEPHIFYALYSLLDPVSLQPGGDNIRFEKSDWFWTDKINNVYFVNDWQIPRIGIDSLVLESGETISTHRSLLITSPEHVPINAHIIDTVYFLDGKPAYIITSVP